MPYSNVIGISIQNQTELRKFVPNAEANNVIAVLAFTTVFDQQSFTFETPSQWISIALCIASEF
jgi:hypothetical protein